MKQVIGKWISPEKRQEYLEAYEEVMRTLPQPESSQVKTSFGSVQVYCWKKNCLNNRSPILLLPGKSSGTPMWYANLPDFCKNRVVYAFDALGDAGLSEQDHPIQNNFEQARWIAETIEKLNVPQFHIIGHSFGGWLSANFASFYPNRVASLVLIEPVFTFQMIKFSIILKSIPYNMRFLPKRWRQCLLKEISGSQNIDITNPVAKMIDSAANYYISKLPKPKMITPKQMCEWEFPVYIAFADNSGVHNSFKALEVAKKNVRSAVCKLWKKATHSLPMEYSEELNYEIIHFIETNET
ncbi:alpha/beta fold hydrolase [Capnocytophaga cynodegmi]|uniref:Putative Carboxylesterase NP n=1 Tax=Capnocytophaga cynodegmi TaxID=28189 RepID=A0A0B7H8M0_9FLAO|nr:alpha/beta hydrolase [Capnocytophaga cynodegmi]CEN34272.1 putative Carboxylesterase NP [Capnocytophaga cynodegmi]CEN37979.1 putative Carboxylesterase NP [Capnocytophaga cynodegmi]